jgi:alpha-galactosidase
VAARRAPRPHRPVNLNVWEAVYFDHDLDRLTSLADLAARVGVERFVLDDGWFAGRRDGRAGLGDWRVDEEVWPGGLHRLVDHVRGRGLRFGLWFEPEMVNPDSELYRADPDWILATGQRTPPLQRGQLVLDLTHPEVGAYLLERMSAILSEYEISYVKWDHNRNLVDAGSGTRAGAPAVHRPCTGRPWPFTRCSTSCGGGTPAWSGSPARPGVAGSTWAYWNEPSGSGPRT